MTRIEATPPGELLVERRHNLSASASPTVNDDSGDGYGVGSLWIDTTNDVVWQAVDVSAGAAVWRLLTPLFPSGGDDSATIQALIDAAATDGGGVVHLGPGTFLAEDLVLKSNVHIRGCGPEATIVKLNDGADTDLFVTDDFASLTTTVSEDGPAKFGLADLTLDGNKANNASGWPLRIYGAAYRMENIDIHSGKSGGVWSEWGISVTLGVEVEPHWSDFKIYENDGIGLHYQGPHDGVFTNGLVFRNTGDGIKTEGEAGGGLFTNVHSWGASQDWAWHLRAPSHLANCVGEGAATGQLLIAAGGCTISGGNYFGQSASPVDIGIQVGDGTSGAVASCVISTYVFGIDTSGQPLYLFNQGSNIIDVVFWANGCTNGLTGTIGNTSQITFVCSDNTALNYDTRLRRISSPPVMGVSTGRYMSAAMGEGSNSAATINRLTLVPLTLMETTSFDQIAVKTTASGSASNTYICVVYADDGRGYPTGSPLLTSSAIDTTVTAGFLPATAISLTLGPGRYFIGGVCQVGSSATFSTYSLNGIGWVMAVESAGQQALAWFQASVSGAPGSFSSTRISTTIAPKVYLRVA